jgi:hypothetical protein
LAALPSAPRARLPCPNLTSINVTGCEGVTDRALLAISAHLRSVQALRLNATRIGDTGLREVGSRTPCMLPVPSPLPPPTLHPPPMFLPD